MLKIKNIIYQIVLFIKNQVFNQAIYVKDYVVDASKSNNNISATRYPACIITDNSDRILTRLESAVNPDGTVGAYLYARNYDTNGNATGQRGISCDVSKSGVGSWSSDPKLIIKKYMTLGVQTQN